MLTGKQKPNLNLDTLRVFLTKSISLFNALTRCISQKKKIVPRSSFLNRHERQCVGQFHPQSRPHTCQEKYCRMKECMGLNIIFLADVGVTQSSAHLQQICGVTFYVILYKKKHILVYPWPHLQTDLCTLEIIQEFQKTWLKFLWYMLHIIFHAHSEIMCLLK